jgi:predicted esterase YcpF (UPF0227 family)
MNDEIANALKPIKEDIKELKLTQARLLELIERFVVIEQRVYNDKKFADEARKVIHKRIDKLEHQIYKIESFTIKIIVGVSSVAVTTLLGILLGVVKL